MPRDVTLLAPVQQAGSALTVEVANLEDKPTVLGFVRYAWPALLGAGGVGLWLDQPTGRVKDCGLGSRLDAARLGGPALSERRDGVPAVLGGLPAAASRDPRAAPTLAVAAPPLPAAPPATESGAAPSGSSAVAGWAALRRG